MTKSDIKAIVIDDSQQARKLLRLMLAEVAPQIEVCAEAENLDEAVLLMRERQPSLVFLDIEMPGKSGLQILDEIDRNELNYEIIFTTAYNQFAIQAFKLSAVDYLLKPLEEQQLKDAIAKASERIKWSSMANEYELLRQNLQNVGDKTLRIPTAMGYVYVNVGNLLYIEADGSYARIHCLDRETITVSKNLKYFETALEGIDFIVRPHRSFLVNIHHIDRFDKSDRGRICMKNGTLIDLSRERRGDFFAALARFNYM
jgi:two-component system, LytTR family, response regulator